MKRAQHLGNPWGLTMLEVAVATAYMQHGTYEKTAAALERDLRSVCNALNRLVRKMGVDNRVQAISKWAEWHARKYADRPRTAWVCPKCTGLGFLTARPA